MEMNRAILRFALTGLVAALLAGSAPSWSQTPAPEAGAKAYALPAELLRAAKRWKVDLKDVTIAVLPVDDVRRTEKDSNVTRVRPVLLHRADVSVAPASSAKVVTTLVALETLGSHYRWYTGFYADEKAEPDAKGVLRSPLYIKGGGDPNFVLEAFDLELTRLREKGIRIDFGLCAPIVDGKVVSNTDSGCGSPAYVAPEIVLGKECTESVDVWAMGIILFAMVHSCLPFDDQNINRLFRKIISLNPKIRKDLNPKLADLISKMLIKNPEKRITISEIFRHPWITSGRSSPRKKSEH